jgi:hypothetical protein
VAWRDYGLVIGLAEAGMSMDADARANWISLDALSWLAGLLVKVRAAATMMTVK